MEVFLLRARFDLSWAIVLADRLNALECKNCDFRQANEILKASTYIAQAEHGREFKREMPSLTSPTKDMSRAQLSGCADRLSHLP